MVLAALLVLWLSTRMWMGESYLVWQGSCLLGAWAPLCAAVIFLYVRAVEGREDSVMAAWLVRALGMHCMLLWLVGVGDFLRGPPGTPPAFNADAGAPLMLLAFAPVFALSVGLVSWVRAVSLRLDGTPVDPLVADPHARERPAAPYRGMSFLRTAAPVARPALTPLCFGALGLLALDSTAHPGLCLALAPVALAAVSLPGWRAVGPSVLSLTALAGVSIAHHASASTLHDAMRWPWLTAGLVGLYLLTVEARMRVSSRLSSRALRAAV